MSAMSADNDEMSAAERRASRGTEVPAHGEDGLKSAEAVIERAAEDYGASAVEATEPSNAEPNNAELGPAERKALRENAKRVLRESGAAEILQTLNKHALQGRGRFEEYDSGVVFKWGTGFTTRHIWVHVSGDRLQFRLKPHLRCSAPIPECDGEYHTFTAATWRIPNAVLREVDRNYKRPVAESSSD